MNWWGKLIGGSLGLALGGPLGAILGVALGHALDSRHRPWASPAHHRLERDDWQAFSTERAQLAFFTATFSVMGHLCKADGQVSEAEISVANEVMDHMDLSSEQRRMARALFQQGKQDGFPLDEALGQLKRECRHSKNLMRMFLELQAHAAMADGTLHPNEVSILEHLCAVLRLPQHELAVVLELIRASNLSSESTNPKALDAAYGALGVKPTDDDATVSRAYRRLISQHHPDKLVARGLPEEMINAATERTQTIRSAYERIRDHRKHPNGRTSA